MYQSLKQLLLHISPFTEEELNESVQYFKPSLLKKGMFFNKEGHMTNNTILKWNSAHLYFKTLVHRAIYSVTERISGSTAAHSVTICGLVLGHVARNVEQDTETALN